MEEKIERVGHVAFGVGVHIRRGRADKRSPLKEVSQNVNGVAYVELAVRIDISREHDVVPVVISRRRKSHMPFATTPITGEGPIRLLRTEADRIDDVEEGGALVIRRAPQEVELIAA